MEINAVNDRIVRAAEWIKSSRHTTVFTGAGISVESGIPPFRGKDGLWNKYDPGLFDIGYFHSHPEKSWALIKEIFFDRFGKVEPHEAHKCIAALEKKGFVKAVITQNIDHLHQKAGSQRVYEFHGTSQRLSCVNCKSTYEAEEVSLEKLPPRCGGCGGVLKPDIIFFGEAIPEEARASSFWEAQVADVFLVIGTTGEIMPACQVPYMAKDNGAKIIEVNVDPSNFTYSITDIFLQGKAGEIMPMLLKEIL
jgi:NAD-dependent deacetylase